MIRRALALLAALAFATPASAGAPTLLTIGIDRTITPNQICIPNGSNCGAVIGTVTGGAFTPTLPFGTTSGTAAAGNDSRITGALQSAGGTMTGTLRGGNLFLGGARPATGSDWLNSIIGGTTVASQMAVLSNTASPAVAAGTRTSDGGATGAMGAWALGGFAINDNTTAIQTAYAQYNEARRYPGAGTTQIGEFNIINEGSTVDSTPYVMHPIGVTLGPWVSCGRTDVSASTPCSLAIGVINNGQPFRKGLAFGSSSLDTSLGVVSTGGTALDLANGHHVRWTYSDDVSQAGITSTVTGGAGKAQELQFTNSGTRLVNSAALPMLAIGSDSTFVNGLAINPGILGNPVTIQAASGSTDTSVGIAFKSYGDTSATYFQNGSGKTTLQVQPVANQANYMVATGAAAGGIPTYQVVGSDTNISLSLAPKGTGFVYAGAGGLSSNGVVKPNVDNAQTLGTTSAAWLNNYTYLQTFNKVASAPSAPGAGKAVTFLTAGTNAGTCKLQVMAGTSTTPVTIADNIGSGC